MIKPPSLRDHLTAALPQLRRKPEDLMMFIKDGHIAATGTKALAWQWHYTVRLIFCDYGGHPDAVMGPVLVWLRAHQSELLHNPDTQKRAIRFDAEYLSSKTMDLVLELDLTEAVVARPKQDGPAGAFELHHRTQPPGPHDMPTDAVTALYLNGQQLAAWPALPSSSAPGA